MEFFSCSLWIIERWGCMTLCHYITKKEWWKLLFESMKSSAYHYIFQEEEATRTNDRWCTATVKRLKEVSPLSLKVSLRSVSYKLTPQLDRLQTPWMSEVMIARFEVLFRFAKADFRLLISASFGNIEWL